MKNICIFLIGFFLNSLLVSSLPEDSPQIWFHPNSESPDFFDLFVKEDQWENARNKIDVFQFYQANVYHQPTNEKITLSRLLDVDAFGKLRAWNISVALEVGAVKPEPACDPAFTSDSVIQTIRNIEEHGGYVTYLSMDEPLYAGTIDFGDISCGFTLEETARRTAIFMKTVQAAYPNVLIGDIEVVYPYFKASDIQRWIIELENNGVTPAFFHYDTDPKGEIVEEDLQILSTFFRERNIPFGVIYHGGVADYLDTSEAFFLNNTLWIMKVKKSIPLADHHIFQSWALTTKNEATIPINLPEYDSTIYSHTRMINEGWAILMDNDAQFISQTVPLEMESGKQYPVTITLKNSGPVSWYGHEGYNLGAQMPTDGLWGLDRVPLDSGEVIAPEQQKTFTFFVTAPWYQDLISFGGACFKKLLNGLEIYAPTYY